MAVLDVVRTGSLVLGKEVPKETNTKTDSLHVELPELSKHELLDPLVQGNQLNLFFFSIRNDMVNDRHNVCCSLHLVSLLISIRVEENILNFLKVK